VVSKIGFDDSVRDRVVTRGRSGREMRERKFACREANRAVGKCRAEESWY